MTHLVWYRSDLRVSDHAALTAATRTGAAVRAVFWCTPKQWQAHGWGRARIDFVLRHVQALQQALAALQITLDVLTTPDFTTLIDDLLQYAQQHQVTDLYYHREYELNERRRDELIQTRLTSHQIACHIGRDQSLIDPDTLFTQAGSPYTVFTPFKRAWMTQIKAMPLEALPVPAVCRHAAQEPGQWPDDLPHDWHDPIQTQWPAGESTAQERLQSFCAGRIKSYQSDRDHPAYDATSGLSPYLSVGALSPRQCLITAWQANQQQWDQGHPGAVHWISELVWREFYKYISHHFPRVCQGHNFNRRYDDLPWREAPDDLALWQQGRTGLPIVDAGIRQMLQTGWMHNRVRMIVAMFLTKNLLIDWRHGEAFFCQHLIDLDFASNNGGWQWSASTGTDAAPYFRIFNPVTQSMKFDPQGVFIKRYCPELAQLPTPACHDPSTHLSEQQLAACHYPRRSVDLKASRARAIAAFRSLAAD